MRHGLMLFRLALGLVLSGYGLTWGAWLYIGQSKPGEALAHALIWGLFGALVAPLAEDVGAMVERLAKQKEARDTGSR